LDRSLLIANNVLNLSSLGFIILFICTVSLPKQMFVSSAMRINLCNFKVLQISLIYSIKMLAVRLNLVILHR